MKSLANLREQFSGFCPSELACYRRQSMAVVAGFVALLVFNVSLDAQSVDRSALNGQQLYQAACAFAELSINRAERSGGRIIADVRVQNLTGHKLPTGYPSRRAWLHFTVSDRNGRTVFESGSIASNGAITGNDNDADAAGIEPHHAEIRTADQVQIYESVMSDSNGQPTTGLLTAVRYLKDNRLVPRGFDKVTADPQIAVVGAAGGDADFGSGGDRVRYTIGINEADGPFQIDVGLRFQVIGFRWAENLRAYKAKETSRFVGYYESMASSSSEVLVARRQVVD